jgi:hypothetical protein
VKMHTYGDRRDPVLDVHYAAMMLVTGGLLRSHNGHKTWVAWAIAGVIAVAGITIRLYRRR